MASPHNFLKTAHHLNDKNPRLYVTMFFIHSHTDVQQTPPTSTRPQIHVTLITDNTNTIFYGRKVDSESKALAGAPQPVWSTSKTTDMVIIHAHGGGVCERVLLPLMGEQAWQSPRKLRSYSPSPLPS